MDHNQRDDTKEPHLRIGEIHHTSRERPHHRQPHRGRSKSHHHNRREYPEQNHNAKEKEDLDSKNEKQKIDPATQLTFPPPAGLIAWTNDSLLSRTEFASPKDLSAHLIALSLFPKNRLYTLRSLPQGYLEIFTENFGIDVDILNSHANRDSELLMASSGRNSRKGIKTFAMNHVDLVQDPRERTMGNLRGRPSSPGQGEDLMSAAERIELTDGYRESWRDRALLCHLTLISMPNSSNGTETMILLLDSSEWKYASFNNSRKRPRETQLSKALSHALWKYEDSVLTLEVLDRHLASCHAQSFEQITQVLSEIAIRQWMDFLRLSQKGAPLYSNTTEIIKSLLCSNLRMSKKLAATIPALKLQGSTYQDDWEFLLAKAKSIKSIPGQKNYKSIYDGVSAALETFKQTGTQDAMQSLFDEYNKIANTVADNDGKSEIDKQTELSINRLQYLTGSLLPFSTVSGILSMGSRFAPGEKYFYIFWVLVIPLSASILIFIVGAIRGNPTIGELEQRRRERERNKWWHEILVEISKFPAGHLLPEEGKYRKEEERQRIRPEREIIRGQQEELLMDQRVGWKGALGTLVGIDPVEARRRSYGIGRI